MFAPAVQSLPAVSSLARARAPFACCVTDRGEGSVLVRLQGALSAAATPRLRASLRCAATSAQLVVLDLRELRCADGIAASILVEEALRASSSGRRVVCVRGTDRVQTALAATPDAGALETVALAPAEPTVQALLSIARRDHAR